MGTAYGAEPTPTDVNREATCNGLPPTITGSSQENILGTAGDDVVITDGAARVDTGAGDDTICITGTGAVVVNAGPGDDYVGARTHIGKTFVSLGFGDDTFLGGEGPDRVWSQESSNQTASDDHDEIDTFGGNDYVISGSSTAPNTDVVDLGTGGDVLVTYGVGTGAFLSGGPGTNDYQPLPGADVRGDWLVDNVTGQALLGDVPSLTWQSFQRFDLRGMQGDRLRYRGSAASEQVTAGGACQVVLRGRAGNDRLTVAPVGCSGLPAGNAVLVGGAGNDRLKGASGDDIMRGGGGRDRGDGGAGDNTCSSIEVATSC
jgi:Ca2+-binding RTX toxin-like protein